MKKIIPMITLSEHTKAEIKDERVIITQDNSHAFGIVKLDEHEWDALRNWVEWQIMMAAKSFEAG